MAGAAHSAGAVSGGSAGTGGGPVGGPQLPPDRGRDDGAGCGLTWAIAGFAATVVAVLLFIAVPAVLISGQQNNCDPAATAEGAADPVTLDQLHIAARIVQVGVETNRPERHIVAALATAFVESEMHNLPAEQSDNDANPNKVSPGHVSSVGVFQQQDLATWTRNGRNRMNVRDAARSFYEHATVIDRPGMTIGQLAQAVQRSRYPDRYDTRVADAERILARVKEDDTLLADTSSSPTPSSSADRAAAAPPASAAAGRATLIWPVAGDHHISSPFGPRPSPCAGCSSLHEGADITAPEGMPVHATAAGRIVQRGAVSGYGNYICIRHEANFSTCYAHLSRYGSYQMGATVDQGAVIGFVGHTGVGTGPHLHFEVRLSPGAGDPAVNPLAFLTGAASPSTDIDATAAMASGGCSDDASGVPDADAPIATGATAELHATTLSAPAAAPAAVKRMIAAGNAIQNLPYTWGGGHNATFTPNPGFDCSATVSFVLHKAGLLDRPLTSGELERYGEPGPGAWVTIYANAGHAFIYIAGQRLDTSAAGSTVNGERGPRWRGPGERLKTGFTVVHPPGL